MNDAPPIIGEERRQPRWRWAIHLILLAGYVLGIGLLSDKRHYSDTQAALPSTVHGLIVLCGFELLFFGGVFAIAMVFSRARIRDLYLRWTGGLWTIFWGAVQSIALRFAVMIVVTMLIVPVIALKGQKSVEGLRPKIENVIDKEAIKDPAYLLFTLTFVSFVVAGLREELWRAGMLAGFAGVAPTIFSSQRGQYIAVVLSAIVFGIGHMPQGWGGVFLTSVLGVGLGTIMVWRKSTWEAAIAHGFFDATSFAALFLILKYFPNLKIV